MTSTSQENEIGDPSLRALIGRFAHAARLDKGAAAK
jgi:hypothetical protein